jgi:hypothetical protein
MKLLSILLLLLSSFSSFAAKELGVGFTLGSLVGVTARQWQGDARAWDAALGWSLGGSPHPILQGAHIWNQEAALYFNEKHPLDLYFAIGGLVEFDDEIELGARVPLGLSYFFANREAEGFAEFTPLLRLVPQTTIGAQIAVGMRVYF